MNVQSSLRGVVLLFLLVGPAGGQGPSSDATGAALLDAAQRNDLPGVLRALDAGADVNATTRYESTALLLAARHVNFEMVKLLVDRGADLDVQDTFYRNTALGSALGGRHMELVRYLLDRGSPGADAVLPVAIGNDDFPLLDAALLRTDISDDVIVGAHALAVKTGKDEAADILSKAIEARPGARDFIVSLPVSVLGEFPGSYRHESTGQSQTIVVDLTDGSLTARFGSRRNLLFATSELSFIAPQMTGTDFRFERRDNVVERLLLTRPGGKDAAATLEFIRIAGDATGSASEEFDPADRAVAPRGTPQPWPSFRGAGASGIGDGQGAAVEWNMETGRNVRWKTPIPGIANSSPVVWGDRVFVSTAISGAGNTTFRTGDYGSVASVDDLSEHTWKLYSLDSESGRIVWEREVHKDIPRTKRHTKGSQASSTPVTDGRRVVVLFGRACRLRHGRWAAMEERPGTPRQRMVLRFHGPVGPQ